MKEIEESLHHAPLGADTQYVNQYDSGLLYPIQRNLNWQARGVEQKTLPFSGVDIWNAYEVSWLNQKGKPVVRLAEFRIPADSTHIIESKSFKLYLNSFNLTAFAAEADVLQRMQADLSEAAGAEVDVKLLALDGAGQVSQFRGECIDELDVDITDYEPNADCLVLREGDTDDVVTESLYSHLLKSNCPVTGQPDWASIVIEYTGAPICREGFLKYLVSYREHGDFHEQCVESIFMDIWQQCQPQNLTVYARYLRRGGLDINPYRSSQAVTPENLRLSRQ
ncbi:NADPH-dependent 7-cyano-7-deazaguanine reductase QueF [Aliamphritea ceti]|uniref:NADPH-dependent 7-cyano-7-deazaguanine reductase QueF n=1 Tax=Aliamphritea ceti TaxID=1524258 RepID=UPI0021C34B5B|nr:NADPH-dependent 7-cyano-7-deazaguanine reductase QueF [Aliamphritea ceti]